jgi:glycerol-3-phosphate cytidylyltransferase
MKKYKVGYTTGVFDLFHIGHLNILKRAKEQCEYLIVGVTTDELVSYKNKKAVIPHNERIAIVESIKYVDYVVPQVNMNKMEAWEKWKFDVMFVGSDWKGTEKWNEFERQFKKVGVDIVYFPYTQGTSSTKLIDVLEKIIMKYGQLADTHLI